MASTSTSMQSELEALRNVYEMSKARVDGTDPQWETRKKMLQDNLFASIKKFQDDDPASKAVFIIGTVQAIVAELDAPRFNVLSYEQKRQRYAQLCAQENKKPVQF